MKRRLKTSSDSAPRPRVNESVVEKRRIEKSHEPECRPLVTPSAAVAKPVGLTLREAIEEFMDDRIAWNRSESTISMYRVGLGRLQEFLGPEKPVDQITSDDLRAFMQKERDQKYAPKTLKTRRQSLTALLIFLLAEEIVTQNPTTRLGPISVPLKVGDPLTVQQVQQLIDACDLSTKQGLRNQLLVLLMADTGGRVSEITNIKLEDIDLSAMRIKVLGKGSKERYLHVSHNTRLAIRRYLHKNSAPNKTFLFESDMGKPITREAAYKIVRNLGESVGMNDMHPHRLRNTFVSEYIENGGDLLTLQYELGHTDISMVKRYATIYPEGAKKRHIEFGVGARLKVSRRTGKTTPK